MLRKRGWLGLAVALCVATGILAIWHSRDGIRSAFPDLMASPIVEKLRPGAPPRRTVPDDANAKLDPVALPDLEAAWRNLQDGRDAQAGKALLEALGARFRAMPPDQSARVMAEFLATTRDARTKLSFTIGNGGNLTTAPTFRVWLMDQLGRVSAEAAATHAAQILASKGSAEEWAIALRDYARVRTARTDTAFLRGKLRELLLEPRWQAEACPAWLEAFDVAVHTHATELTPELARLLIRTAPESKAVAHAAYLTLDRLILSDPVVMLSRLQSEPDLLKGRELCQAGYFARADVRDPQQRMLVERYLLDLGRSPDELEKFAGVYPNANLKISKNLLTSTITPTREEWQARDQAAFQVVSSWLNDSRFARLRPHVETIHSRLSDFLREGEK